jgi:hypothetical protein
MRLCGECCSSDARYGDRRRAQHFEQRLGVDR